MAFYKNKASQYFVVYAYDGTDGTPVTGDADNITAQISKDKGACAATNDTNPSELDATDAPGIYVFDAATAESNADIIVVAPVSETEDVLIDPLIIYTEPEQRVAASVTGAVGSVTSPVSLTSAYDAAKTAAQAATALSTAVWTNTIAGYIDAAISSRSTLAAGAAMTLTGAYDAAKTAAQAGTALSTAVWTNTKAGYLDAAISGKSTLTAAQVWAYEGARTLTSFGTLVSDIWTGVANSSGVNTLLERLSELRAGYLDKLNIGGANALAHSGAADYYKADLSDVALENTSQGILTAMGEIGTGSAPTTQEIDDKLTLSHGTGLWTASATGSGNVYINHLTKDDYGETMYFQLGNGAGIVGATVTAFVKSEYDAGLRLSNGTTATIAGGAWLEPLKLFSGVEYVIEFYDAEYNIASTVVTPS